MADSPAELDIETPPPAAPEPDVTAAPAAVDPPADEPPTRPKRGRPRGSKTRNRSSSRKSSTDRAPRSSTPRKPPLAPRIEAIHGVVGGGLAVGALMGHAPAWVGAAGQQLVADAAEFGKAWDAYAKTNPQVREWIERLLAVSELGTLLTLYVKVGVAAAVSAGVVPDVAGQVLGVGVPEAPPADDPAAGGQAPA